MGTGGVPSSREVIGGKLDDHVSRTDHAEILAGEALQGAGIGAQAVDPAAQLVDPALGVLDPGLQQALALPGGGEVAGALPGRDAEERHEQEDSAAHDRAERIEPGGRGSRAQGDQRGNAAAPG